MEVTYSGYADTVTHAEASITLTKVGRQAQTGRVVSVVFDGIANRLRSDVDVRGCFDGAQARRVRDAVWDTGSSSTVISEELARSMGLQPVDTGVIVTMMGARESCLYMLDITIAPGMVVRNVKANACDLGSREMELVLGMDVISKGKLTIDSTGASTWMEFILPVSA